MVTTPGEPVVTYEVWQERQGWEPERRHDGERGYDSPRVPRMICHEYATEQKWHDEHKWPPRTDPTPSTRYFVVKATTTFEEVPDE